MSYQQEESRTQDSPSIEEHLASLSLHTKPLSIDEIQQLLSAFASDTAKLAQFERFDETSYCRNRIFRNDTLDLLLLCWKPGQRTPIHDHSGSTCGVYVVKGEATEIGFSPSGSGVLLPRDCKQLHQGDITVSIDSDAHMVANFAANQSELVTLHCYSPPLDSMRVFEERETFFSSYPSLISSVEQQACYRVKP